MADRQCQNIAPHPAHRWSLVPFESPFGYLGHVCAGVPSSDVAGQASSSSTRADADTDSLWRYAVSWRESGAVLGPDLMLWAGREIDRLRTVIDDAPHGEWCKASWGEDPCGCWKATALTAEPVEEC